MYLDNRWKLTSAENEKGHYFIHYQSLKCWPQDKVSGDFCAFCCLWDKSHCTVTWRRAFRRGITKFNLHGVHYQLVPTAAWRSRDLYWPIRVLYFGYFWKRNTRVVECGINPCSVACMGSKESICVSLSCSGSPYCTLNNNNKTKHNVKPN